MQSFKEIKSKESTLLSAIELTKTEFVEKYKQYDKYEVSSSWHTLRSSSKGQKLMDMKKSKAKLNDGDAVEITKIGGTVAASLVSADDADELLDGPADEVYTDELEEHVLEEEVLEEKIVAVAKKPKAKKEPKPKAEKKVVDEVTKDTKEEDQPEPDHQEKSPAASEGPSRLEQVKALYESGVTSASKIAKEIGANPSYVFTLLKKIKAQ